MHADWSLGVSAKGDRRRRAGKRLWEGRVRPAPVAQVLAVGERLRCRQPEGRRGEVEERMMEEFHKAEAVMAAGPERSLGHGRLPPWDLSADIIVRVLAPLYYISGSLTHKSPARLRPGALEQRAALI